MNKYPNLYNVILGCLLFTSVPCQESISAQVSLPPAVLAFPVDEAALQLQPQPAAIWGEQKILAWAVARGFQFTADSPEGGWQFRRAAMLEADSYKFWLYAPVDLRGDTYRTGWVLVLDVAAPVFSSMRSAVATDKTIYTAITTADIYVDGIWSGRIEAGFGRSLVTPIRLPIPYIRHPDGRVSIELKMPNRSDNVLFLYDAFLARE